MLGSIASLAFHFWKPLTFVAVLAAITGWHFNETRKARNEGFAACEAIGKADMDRRIKDALEAERHLLFGNDGKRLHDNDKFKRKD